jgi:hypothetical protein
VKHRLFNSFLTGPKCIHKTFDTKFNPSKSWLPPICVQSIAPGGLTRGPKRSSEQVTNWSQQIGFRQNSPLSQIHNPRSLTRWRISVRSAPSCPPAVGFRPLLPSTGVSTGQDFMSGQLAPWSVMRSNHAVRQQHLTILEIMANPVVSRVRYVILLPFEARYRCGVHLQIRNTTPMIRGRLRRRDGTHTTFRSWTLPRHGLVKLAPPPSSGFASGTKSLTRSNVSYYLSFSTVWRTAATSPVVVIAGRTDRKTHQTQMCSLCLREKCHSLLHYPHNIEWMILRRKDQ